MCLAQRDQENRKRLKTRKEGFFGLILEILNKMKRQEREQRDFSC
jgi:hypothetical protein